MFVLSTVVRLLTAYYDVVNTSLLLALFIAETYLGNALSCIDPTAYKNSVFSDKALQASISVDAFSGTTFLASSSFLIRIVAHC